MEADECFCGPFKSANDLQGFGGFGLFGLHQHAGHDERGEDGNNDDDNQHFDKRETFSRDFHGLPPIQSEKMMTSIASASPYKI